MGKISKGITCNVENCNEKAEKSLSFDRASLSESLKFSLKSRKVYLCKKHYKIWKKETKDYREIERIRW